MKGISQRVEIQWSQNEDHPVVFSVSRKSRRSREGGLITKVSAGPNGVQRSYIEISILEKSNGLEGNQGNVADRGRTFE